MPHASPLRHGEGTERTDVMWGLGVRGQGEGDRMLSPLGSDHGRGAGRVTEVAAGPAIGLPGLRWRRKVTGCKTLWQEPRQEDRGGQASGRPRVCAS